MGRKSFDSLEADAEQLIRVWTANPKFSLGEVTLPTVQSMLADLKATRTMTDDLRTQLTKTTNDGNDQAAELMEIVSRGRSGIRAHFGADSAQYEQVGGTRTSHRKSRKPKAAAKAASA